MSKFGGFFARKTGTVEHLPTPTPNVTALPENPLELDEELFSTLGAQFGGDNESLRNLMLDANAKIAELDIIKAAVGKLGKARPADRAGQAALVRAEDTVSSLQARINDLENALSANKQANEQHIEELNTALRREKLERAVVEGALETGRKDFSRLMREVMAMQRSQQEAEEPANPRAANAA